MVGCGITWWNSPILHLCDLIAPGLDAVKSAGNQRLAMSRTLDPGRAGSQGRDTWSVIPRTRMHLWWCAKWDMSLGRESEAGTRRLAGLAGLVESRRERDREMDRPTPTGPAGIAGGKEDWRMLVDKCCPSR